MGFRVHEPPVIGNWYWDVERSYQFEVVAKDDVDGEIEIQYFEGELEEIDEGAWYEMNVISVAAPKDWTGPYEIDKDQFPELKEEKYPLNENPLDYYIQ